MLFCTSRFYGELVLFIPVVLTVSIFLQCVVTQNQLHTCCGGASLEGRRKRQYKSVRRESLMKKLLHLFHQCHVLIRLG
jgi:hypothetical protein